MQMMVPDYWKGRGRYSKQACSRKVVDNRPLHPAGEDAENQGEK